MARGKGQQPPHGGGVPPGTSSIDVEGLLRHSKALMKDKDPEKVKRVLILMSDTGGGHRASAQVRNRGKHMKTYTHTRGEDGRLVFNVHY